MSSAVGSQANKQKAFAGAAASIVANNANAMSFNLIMSNALSVSGGRRINAAALIHTLDSDLRMTDLAPKPLVRPAGGQQFRCFRGIAGHSIEVAASRGAGVGGAPAGPAAPSS